MSDFFFKFASENARREFPAKPIHRITRWTVGTPNDQLLNETPLCGRRDNEAMVNRTEHAEVVTCPQCKAYAEYLTSELDPRD